LISTRKNQTNETVREEGERELRRTPFALAWSGLAAGLSMGFSLVTQGLLHTFLPIVIHALARTRVHEKG
jgi:formate/nitrite transporter FocA (FNT family)